MSPKEPKTGDFHFIYAILSLFVLKKAKRNSDFDTLYHLSLIGTFFISWSENEIYNYFFVIAKYAIKKSKIAIFDTFRVFWQTKKGNFSHIFKRPLPLKCNSAIKVEISEQNTQWGFTVHKPQLSSALLCCLKEDFNPVVYLSYWQLWISGGKVQ